MSHRFRARRRRIPGPCWRWLRPGHCWLAVLGVLVLVSPTTAGVSFYHDRAAYSAALGGAVAYTEDFESYSIGDIPLGGRRGDFLYDFDPTLIQPAIVSDGLGGQALGGSPFEVFVGGDSVTLDYAPLNPVQPSRLLAFGAEFFYAPSGPEIPADTYRLGLGDGAAMGAFVGNLTGLDQGGGSFFLGIIADPDSSFSRVSLSSVQQDPSFLVPAYQVDNLSYAVVPEPATSSLVVVGVVLLLVHARHHR